ncbi:Protein arginine N-methyltransferase [Sergentomyia squamirostris]
MSRGHKVDSLKIAVVAVLVIGAAVLTFFGIVCCLRATPRASRALALPIPLLPDDQTPLNAEPEHPVPMLSVQSPGCAGMERLGVPARTSLNSPSVHDDRNHISRRIRVDAIQARDSLQHQNVIRCPHHVPIGGDSEWGADRDLHIRAPYQTEITRTYIRPPPNKTALDVPDTSYSSVAFTQRSGGSTSSVNKSSKSSSFKSLFWRARESPSRSIASSSSTLAVTLPPPAAHCHTSRPALDPAPPNIVENGQHI